MMEKNNRKTREKELMGMVRLCRSSDNLHSIQIYNKKIIKIITINNNNKRQTKINNNYLMIKIHQQIIMTMMGQ